MKNLMLFISTIILGYMSNAQDDISNFKVPENEYILTKKINELEIKENKLKISLENSKRLKLVIDYNLNNLSELNNVNINSRESLSELNKKYNLKSIKRFEYEKFSNPEFIEMSEYISSKTYLYGFDDFYLDNDYKPIDYAKIDSQFKKEIIQIKDEFSRYKDRISIITISIKKDLAVVTQKLNKLYNSDHQNKGLHWVAIVMGLPAFCITILLLFIVPYLLERKYAGNNSENNKEYLLDVATVLLLTMTILILGLAKIIHNEVLGTLLGGISGYVLNRASKSNQSIEAKSHEIHNKN